MAIADPVGEADRVVRLKSINGRTDRGLHLAFLGTAGGPLPLARAGTSTVLEIDGLAYVIDAGAGMLRNFGLSGLSFRDVRGMFLTHMHSDHTADWFNFFLLQWNTWGDNHVDVFGPGPLRAGADTAQMHTVLPGMQECLVHQLEANAADITLRMRGEATRPFPGGPESDAMTVHDLPVHPDTSYDNRWPDSDPVTVYADDNVTVSAIQVRHGEIVPAYAFRFDTAHGSVVFSGDTAPCDNFARLCAGADVLVCEVLALPESLAWIRTRTDAAALQTIKRHFVRAHVLLDATSTDRGEPDQPGIGHLAAESGVKTLVLTHLVPGDGSVASEVFRERAQQGFSGNVVVAEDLHRLTIDARISAVH